MENHIFWSKIGSGFEESGGTPPPRNRRSTPPPGASPFWQVDSIAVFCLQNLICLLLIFADQVFIDPTFCGIFVCGPLQSFAVNVSLLASCFYWLAETPRPCVPHKLAIKWHPFQSKPDRSQLALNSQTAFNNLHLLCWETIYTFLGTNNSVLNKAQNKNVKRYNEKDLFYSIQSSLVTVKASEYLSGRKLIGS